MNNSPDSGLTPGRDIALHLWGGLDVGPHHPDFVDSRSTRDPAGRPLPECLPSHRQVSEAMPPHLQRAGLSRGLRVRGSAVINNLCHIKHPLLATAGRS